MNSLLRSAVAGAILLGERWRHGIAYNPMSRELAQNPYPWYAALRARNGPHVPHKSLLLDSWLFAHHADVDLILRDHRHFSNDPRNGRMSRSRRHSLPDANSYTMLFLDPPDHTRLRSLVNKAFTPRAVNGLERHVRELAHQLFDDIPDPSAFDLMQAIANPLPVIVIAEMLGVPPEDRARFGVWSNQRARILEPTISPAERKVADEAALALDAYFDPIIEQRRREPRDDIISSLVHAEEEGDRLSGRELFLMLRLPARCRQRDHDQPDRQRHARDAAPSRNARASPG